MEQQVKDLEEQLEAAKRKTQIVEIYKAADSEQTVSYIFTLWRTIDNLSMFQNALGMKAIMAKLSGFAKFDVDHKLNSEQFFNLFFQASHVKNPNAEQQDSIKSIEQPNSARKSGLESSAPDLATGLFVQERFD